MTFATTALNAFHAAVSLKNVVMSFRALKLALQIVIVIMDVVHLVTVVRQLIFAKEAIKMTLITATWIKNANRGRV